VAKVRHLVADRLGVDVQTLQADVELGADLAVDSLDLADLALALEEELSIVISDDALATVRTFGDLVGVARPRSRAGDVVPDEPRTGGWMPLGLAALLRR
jgi:acyl carrier protein